jgi:hypothetical protein
MKIYLAGPMTGLPEFNFPAFDEAAKRFEELGHTVFNPAQMDRDVGFDPSSAEVSNEFLRDALRRDLSAICDADAIAMLPGWERSGGAMVEWHLARHLGLRLIYIDCGIQTANQAEKGGQRANWWNLEPTQPYASRTS